MNQTPPPPHSSLSAYQHPNAGASVAGVISAPVPDGPWGEFVVGLTGPQVAEAARTLSRRGKLPGYAPAGDDGALFTFTAFGAPLDYVVSAVASAQDRDGRTRVAFHAKLRPRVPLIFAAVTVVSIWPGAPITDSLIRSYFPSYDYPQWVTWAWYLPLTVVPLPFMLWRMWRNSKRAAHEHCVESVEVIRGAVGGAAASRGVP